MQPRNKLARLSEITDNQISLKKTTHTQGFTILALNYVLHLLYNEIL